MKLSGKKWWNFLTIVFVCWSPHPDWRGLKKKNRTKQKQKNTHMFTTPLGKKIKVPCNYFNKNFVFFCSKEINLFCVQIYMILAQEGFLLLWTINIFEVNSYKVWLLFCQANSHFIQPNIHNYSLGFACHCYFILVLYKWCIIFMIF